MTVVVTATQPPQAVLMMEFMQWHLSRQPGPGPDFHQGSGSAAVTADRTGPGMLMNYRRRAANCPAVAAVQRPACLTWASLARELRGGAEVSQIRGRGLVICSAGALPPPPAGRSRGSRGAGCRVGSCTGVRWCFPDS